MPLNKLKLRWSVFADGLEQGQQPFVDTLIAGNDVTFTENLVLAVTIGDETTGLPHENQSRRQVPRLQSSFPITVQSSRRYPGEIKRSGAKAPHPGHVLLHGADFLSRQAHIAMSVVSNSARDDCLGKPRSRSDTNALIIQERALALFGHEHFIACRIVDQAGNHGAVALERHRNCEVGDAVQKIGGAVERIYDPHMTLVSAFATATFFTEKTIARSCLHELRVDGFFGATVGGRNEIGRALQRNL